MGTVFLCYTSQKAEVSQKEPVPCLKQNPIPRFLLLNPQKGILYFLTDCFSANSTWEALLCCVRTPQGRKAPPWPYLSWALALQGFVYVFSHLHQSNSSALSMTIHVLSFAHALVFAGLCSHCILCCIISCNVLHCHLAYILHFSSAPGANRMVHDGQRALLVLMVSFWTFPLIPL